MKKYYQIIGLFVISLVLFTPITLALNLAHFTQADTVIGDVYDPLSLNRYAYARNNPVKYTDPSGNFICGGVCLAAAGIAAWTIGGATVAAGIDYLYQIGWQDRSLFEGTIDWGSVGKSAAVGGAASGIGSLSFSLLAPAISLVGPELVVGGTGIAAYSAGQATHNALSGNELSSGLDDNSLATAYAGSIAAGGILSKVGSWVGGGGRSGSISTKSPNLGKINSNKNYHFLRTDIPKETGEIRRVDIHQGPLHHPDTFPHIQTFEYNYNPLNNRIGSYKIIKHNIPTNDVWSSAYKIIDDWNDYVVYTTPR